MTKLTRIFTACIAAMMVCSIAGAAAYKDGGGSVRALGLNKSDISDYPFTMGFYALEDLAPGEGGAVITLTDSSTSVYYAIGQVYNNGYFILGRNVQTYFLYDTEGTGVTQDSIPDTVVGIFASNTSKRLYVNGSQSAEWTNVLGFNSGANDICMYEYCRNGPLVGSFDGTVHHAWICGRELSDTEVQRYHDTRDDKDMIEQICRTVPGTIFYHYDMQWMPIFTVELPGEKERLENGETIYDVSGNEAHLTIINAFTSLPLDDAFGFEGTASPQSSP